MRHYIFITPEGFTYQPNSTTTQPDAENCQVIGFGKGEGVTEAFENFFSDNPWLLETTYSHVIAYELKSEQIVGNYWIQDQYL